jgi:MFS transporter, DHA2 family, multidrug resistance protein
MASSIESVSYELGSLAGVTVLGTILTAVYASTIHLPATAPAEADGSIDQARAAAGHLPAGQAHTLLDAAASAFDHGYTLALAITAIALAAGSAFTYRYLNRQPTPPAEQAQHPEPAQHGGQPLEPAGSGRRTAPTPQRRRTAQPTTGGSDDRTRVL